MSRGRLKIEDEETIRRNYRYLKKELESRDLLDYLYEKKVISLEDKNRIHDGKIRSERNEDLLQTILHSGPGPSFDYFLSSLEERYSQVCTQLKTKDVVSPCESPDDVVTVMTEVKHLSRVENDNDSETQLLNDELAQKDVKLENVSTELKEVKAELAQSVVKIEKLYEQLTEVTAERDGSSLTKRKLTDETAAFMTKPKKLCLSKEDENDEIQRLHEKLTATENECENLRKQLSELTEERDEVRAQLMETCDDNKQLQSSLDMAQRKLMEILDKQFSVDPSYIKTLYPHDSPSMKHDLESRPYSVKMLSNPPRVMEWDMHIMTSFEHLDSDIARLVEEQWIQAYAVLRSQ